MEEGKNKLGKVCVTGGKSFVASWLIMRLLQRGYYVNTTIRSSPQGNKNDISHLTNLPGASEKLQIFNADLNNPESFKEAIEGCIGVFHLAHPIDFERKETEEVMNNKAVNGTLGILQSCLDSKTVKRVVYTSSIATVPLNNENKGLNVVDESSWTDMNYVRNLNIVTSPYFTSKTLTEKAALEFAEKNSLDLVTLIPSWINGPFITENCPVSVQSALSMIIENEHTLDLPECVPFVHVNDVVSAHMFLFEYPEAKGRYICTAFDITYDKLCEFLRQRYPQYRITSQDSSGDGLLKYDRLSSQKLLDTGFRFKYGLGEMYDAAIECCKDKGLL